MCACRLLGWAIVAPTITHWSSLFQPQLQPTEQPTQPTGCLLLLMHHLSSSWEPTAPLLTPLLVDMRPQPLCAVQPLLLLSALLANKPGLIQQLGKFGNNSCKSMQFWDFAFWSTLSWSPSWCYWAVGLLEGVLDFSASLGTWDAHVQHNGKLCCTELQTCRVSWLDMYNCLDLLSNYQYNAKPYNAV